MQRWCETGSSVVIVLLTLNDVRACRPHSRSITYLLLQDDEVEMLAKVLPTLPNLRLLRYA